MKNQYQDVIVKSPLLASYLAILMHPWKIIVVALLLLGLAASQMRFLEKDTRSDAFLAADNPALVYKNKVKELFGLADPLVIAIVNESPEGIFNPTSLQLVDWLSRALEANELVDPERITSLATENNIRGTEEGMEVEPFFDSYPDNAANVELIREAVEGFPLYHGSLVSKDGKATMIVAELYQESDAETLYPQLLEIISRAPVGENDKIHLAGEGAVAGYLGAYIDADASRLNPLAALIITLIIILAFRRLLPALFGNFIIAASVLITMGSMAAAGVNFFVITNAMPVILIGISVADTIHILSEYYSRQANQPEFSLERNLRSTMAEMWRPVTLTTLTTAAGFLGLYLSAYMPPFKYFGLYTAIGVMVAWLYSLLLLPALILVFKPQAHKSFIANTSPSLAGDPASKASVAGHDIFSRWMSHLGQFSIAKPRLLITFAAALIVFGLMISSQLKVNENRIDTFDSSEAIHKADKAINHHFDGSNRLNIVIETDKTEGLFDVDVLKKVEALQVYAESLETVRGSSSIVDYLKQMNRSLNEGQDSAYRLPANRDLVAQYFLLYSTSADPTDFEEEVDYDYRQAVVRLNLSKGSFLATKPVVENLQNYIDSEFNQDGLRADISGRVYVNYHWIKDLGQSHFRGVFIALGLVLLISALLFRSLLVGVLALLPVACSILLVYSIMTMAGIPLGIGTSMFASVAIGLGVDFSIHTLDKMRSEFARNPKDVDSAILAIFPNTGRALLFNFLAIACGFGVLITSKVVPLMYFGSIVALSVTCSFLISMVLLPALVKVFKPAAICGQKSTYENHQPIKNLSGESYENSAS